MTSAGVTFGHVSIVARDWRLLSRFYQSVFGCVPVPPRRQLSGAWLEAGTGVEAVALEGEHLRLPGHGPTGPTLASEGGRGLGTASSAEVPGKGRLTFVDACDPEDNIIELQSWERG